MRALPYEEGVEAIALETAMKRWEPLIAAYARRCAKGDAEFVKDLRQEAWIALWDLDLTRFRAEDDSCVKRVILTAIKRGTRAVNRTLSRDSTLPDCSI